MVLAYGTQQEEWSYFSLHSQSPTEPKAVRVGVETKFTDEAISMPWV